jgi:transposase-like protein
MKPSTSSSRSSLTRSSLAKATTTAAGISSSRSLSSSSSLSSSLSSSSSAIAGVAAPDASAARNGNGHYTHVYKIAAVRYAVACGKAQRRAAADMGISENTLSTWIRDAKPSPAGVVDVERFDELAQLRTQNRELLAANLRISQ